MGKAKITEEMLTKNEIPLLEMSKLKYDNKNPIAISAYGKFYQGKYNNENISFKVVDITIDQIIMNEFILWKYYQNNPCFLKLKGVILYKNEAYIIFQDYFKETLENLLEQKKLKENQKIMICKQILNILNSLKQEKKFIGDLRPGTFIINSDKKVKLIDFGMMINMQKFIYDEEIKNIRIKYSPPEYILQNIIDQSYDIYSFGCILIDLFAVDYKETIINKKNIPYQEFLSEIKENKYHKIPNNINCLLYEIISKCINKNYQKRIKINELVYNLSALLNYLKDNNLKNPLQDNNLNNEELKNDDLIENERTKKYKEVFNYAKNLNKETILTCKHINSDLQEKILNMKNELLNSYDNTIKELNINYKLIKDKIEVIFNTNKKLIDLFYHKIMENITQMQNLLSNSINDILDIQNQVNGIQTDLYIFNKFINQDKYEYINNSIENSQKEVDKLINKYSNKKNFDLIDISCDSCLNLVNNYTILNKNFILDLKAGLEHLSNIKGLNNDNKIIEQLGDEFFMQKLINNIMIPKNNELNKKEEIKNNNKNEKENDNNEYEEKEEIENEEENYEQLISSMTENIYAKIVENNNLLTIFNYYTNKINNYIVSSNDKKDFKFNSNCYSLYEKEKNCVYVCGGLTDINDQNSHDNSLYKININLIIHNKNENKDNNNIFNDINNIIKDDKNKDKKYYYEFIIESLSPMNNNRSYHSMIQLSSNRNIILCIGGINTESCEVYNIELDSWVSIQDLPIVCQNPGIIDHNRFIYVFPYSNEFNTIYKLNMSNKDFIWENIKYNINDGKIRKGMAAISIENNIYLLGGYDNENQYSNVYNVDISNEDFIEIKSLVNLVLPNKCFFNSNYIIINNFNKLNNEIIDNENNVGYHNNRVLLMDNFNGILEFDWFLGKFYHYLE